MTRAWWLAGQRSDGRCSVRLAPVFVLWAALCSLAGCAAELESQSVELASDSGALLGNFVPLPDPPKPGNTEMLVTIRPAAGEPNAMPRGAAMSFQSIVPWMPAHGHGTSVQPVATEIEPDAAGARQFRVAPVRYTMSGLWEVTFELLVDGAVHRFVVPQRVQ